MKRLADQAAYITTLEPEFHALSDEELRDKTGVQHSCVYIPTTPNPTSGFIVMVPATEVVELQMTVDAAMKMIITCGVVMPPPPSTTGSRPKISLDA